MSQESSAKILLEDIKIASPCSVAWDNMARTSDEAKRFCGDCRKHVYSIDKLSASEALALIEKATQPESSVCIQLYRRADGTIITDDCPVGLRRIRNTWRQIKAAVASVLLLLGVLPALADSTSDPPSTSHRTLGKIKMSRPTVAPNDADRPVVTAPTQNAPKATDTQTNSQGQEKH